MHTTIPDPLRHYRAADLIAARYTPYRNVKTVRAWMLKVGGRHLTKRTVTITGQALIEALKTM